MKSRLTDVGFLASLTEVNTSEWGSYDEMIRRYSRETPVTAARRAIHVSQAGKMEQERIKKAGNLVL